MKYFKWNAMKRNLLIVIILLLPLTVISAQNANRERLEAYRIGFFTKKLSLTSGEAEKFWPIYNDYQKQKNDLQIKRRDLIRDFNQNESTLNDKELTEIGDNLVSTLSVETEMARTFHIKLKELLPPDKVIRYYQAENQWKAQLLNELQENRPLQRPNQRF
ncbi:MAG: hypothetical protein A2X04_06835 [Bacteroidetes bacterium GWF2_41_9]|nr:MAG: hypothetical protein A2X04_06835 [Bacteroidetes bacterium GWF2_41_9]HAM10760.1 hypothetical protein [Bacteroidales bacterium]HBQ83317.1 hypothetical protein [Bacteroidales bacterium]